MIRLLINKQQARPILFRGYTVFKTAQSKANREGIPRNSEKNMKKEYLRQKGHSHSSTIWLDRQLRDPYTNQVLLFIVV